MEKIKRIRNSRFVKRHSLKVLVFLIFFSIFFLAISFSNSASAADNKTDPWWYYIFPIAGVVAHGGADVAVNIVFTGINMLLHVLFYFMGVLLIIAGVLFDWAINPNNFTAVMKMNAIYSSWTIVRDFLNLAFILVLLYSAFCTIFQIEKYHLKNILRTLVLMALLVNFSFPVARFVIDTSNVMMYYIISQAFPWVNEGSGLSTSIAKFSDIIKQLVPNGSVSGGAKVETVQLLAAIIFMFLLAVTLLVMGMLLIIRIVVLAILIIFSSIGFVAAIFPSTKNYADSWWNQLFKQSFFGPIMAFMLYISLTILKEIKDNDIGKMASFAAQNVDKEAANYSTLIVTGTAMAIPIVLLWTGIIVSQKMGAIGADFAKKAGLGLMNKVSGINALKRRYAAFKTERKKREDEKIKGSVAVELARGLSRFQDETIGKIPIIGAKAKKRAEKMKATANKEAIENDSKKHEGTRAAILAKDIDLAITSPPPKKDDKIEAAGKVKQALSRRGEFEKAIEERIENDIVSGKLTPPSPITPSPTAPTLVAVPILSATPKTKEVQDRNDIIRANEKLEKQYEKNQEKWKKDNEQREKDFIQEQKTLYMENARKIIADAEKA